MKFFVDLLTSHQICSINDMTENKAKCHLPAVSGFYEISVRTENDGRSSMSRKKLPIMGEKYDLMVFPVIEKLQRDQSGLLHIFGNGFERSCEVTIGDWTCKTIKDTVLPEYFSCNPVEPRVVLN